VREGGVLEIGIIAAVALAVVVLVVVRIRWLKRRMDLLPQRREAINHVRSARKNWKLDGKTSTTSASLAEAHLIARLVFSQKVSDRLGELTQIVSTLERKPVDDRVDWLDEDAVVAASIEIQEVLEQMEAEVS
jgi:hypothetical protein